MRIPVGILALGLGVAALFVLRDRHPPATPRPTAGGGGAHPRAPDTPDAPVQPPARRTVRVRVECVGPDGAPTAVPGGHVGLETLGQHRAALGTVPLDTTGAADVTDVLRDGGWLPAPPPTPDRTTTTDLRFTVHRGERDAPIGEHTLSQAKLRARVHAAREAYEDAAVIRIRVPAQR